MRMEDLLRKGVREAIRSLYNADVTDDLLQIQKTRKEFTGDLTLVAFPITRISHKSPEQTGKDIGDYLAQHIDAVSGFNVIKGFLNIVISPIVWARQLGIISDEKEYGFNQPGRDAAMVVIEYSSPNTNKPLHLGHIRNNLLGYSLYRILSACGHRVIKTNIVNDRGIHICLSLIAWQKLGNGETPESSGKKGDHLVGEYYVKFDQLFKAEVAALIAEGLSEDEAKEKSPIINEAREMLRKWEANDPETRDLWQRMNNWVYKGFDETYKTLGVDFDKIYYESNTYTVGRDEVLRGVKEGIFEQMDDNSVWANLEKDGLDKKILLRSDGTSVYMTQDIGTAKIRYADFPIDHMIYVVGNEQNYHFQVLSLLLDKLGYKWGKDLYHFSYGMVELPQGRMKSREGTVVDADDLVADMIDVARKVSEELGKLDGYTEVELS